MIFWLVCLENHKNSFSKEINRTFSIGLFENHKNSISEDRNRICLIGVLTKAIKIQFPMGEIRFLRLVYKFSSKGKEIGFL